jgi:hypothetical protein
MQFLRSVADLQGDSVTASADGSEFREQIERSTGLRRGAERGTLTCRSGCGQT